MKKQITVLDTDLGTDDACALLLLKILPGQPDYIVASHGNTTLEYACKNAVLLKKYLGLKAKTVHGLPSPVKENTSEEPFHGKDGLGGYADGIIKRLNITDSDFKELIPFDEFKTELRKADSVTFITIGTLTNFSDILNDEVIKRKIKHVYVMGGGFREFNQPNNTEFNFSKDPKSVKKLLSSGLDITLFPLDVTNHCFLTCEQIKNLEKTGAYPDFIDFIKFNLQSNYKFNGTDGAVLHDTLPVMYHSFPELFEIKNMHVESDEYGSTVISENGNEIKVCTGTKNGILYEMMKKVFENG